jgi:hypothetical protein
MLVLLLLIIITAVAASSASWKNQIISFALHKAIER